MPRPRTIPLAVAALVILSIPTFAVPQVTGDLDALREQALDLVNEDRRENGLAELTDGENLNEAAQAHALDMLRRDYYAHASPEGDTVLDRFITAGGSEWELVAENIARCTGCPVPPDPAQVQEFQQGWMDSPEHRANILSDGLSRFGFGIAGGEGEPLYAVQTFAGPGGSRQEAPDDPDPIGAEALMAQALSLVNEARQEADLNPLAEGPALTSAAQDLIPEDLSGFTLSDLGDPFDALPEEDRQGWSRVATIAASCGGCGSEVTKGDIRSFVTDWLDEGAYRETLLDPGLTHLGMAIRPNGEGRKVALAILAEERFD